MTKEQLEILKNTKLADGQPITAATHRSFEQDMINEMYNANSRAAVVAQADEVAATLLSGDLVFIKRGAAGVFIPKDAFALTVGSLRQTLTKNAHGFVVGNILTIDSSGVFVKVSNAASNRFFGVVTAVPDVNTFTVTYSGYVSGLSGLVAGSTYYSTNAGVLSTTVSYMPVLKAVSASAGYIVPAVKNNYRSVYDLSTEVYPSTGGTADNGDPEPGNYWIGGNSGDFVVQGLGTVTLFRGAMLHYIGGDVSDPNSWVVKQ